MYEQTSTDGTVKAQKVYCTCRSTPLSFALIIAPSKTRCWASVRPVELFLMILNAWYSGELWPRRWLMRTCNGFSWSIAARSSSLFFTPCTRHRFLRTAQQAQSRCYWCVLSGCASILPPLGLRRDAHLQMCDNAPRKVETIIETFIGIDKVSPGGRRRGLQLVDVLL